MIQNSAAGRSATYSLITKLKEQEVSYSITGCIEYLVTRYSNFGFEIRRLCLLAGDFVVK